MGLEVLMWRAIAVFRVAALVYAVVLTVNSYQTYTRPWLGWTVIGVMTAWTVFVTFAYARPQRRIWFILTADLLVALVCLLASREVIPADVLAQGAPTLPMAWVAGAVLAWGIVGGRDSGAIAALIVGSADIWQRGGLSTVTLNGLVLLLLAGVIVGYILSIGKQAEARMQRAVELEAATRERERLARGIHDSVLQVLAFVQRRGAEIGGEAAELGRLAGQQEATLRALVAVPYRAGASAGSTQDDSLTDLRLLISEHAAPEVTLALPATPVILRREVAQEISAAVGSALDNVRIHCGPQARAWVLVEDEADEVTVSVRDNGPGIPDGRLELAVSAGRLGVAQSIQGRLRDLGGSAIITSTPGEGTEVEMTVSR